MAIESHGGRNYGILAQRFMSAGQWDRSLVTAMEWLSQQPENPRAHRAAAQSLINLERTEEAGQHLEKVLAGNPNDDFAHRMMAMVYSKTGRFRLADESIHKAISLKPNDANHWHQLALMSYRQGDLATAKKSVARARELNPLNANIINLAILCEPSGPEAAGQKIERFKEALALDPVNANIYNNMGAQYLDNLKDYPRAEECFRRALFFDPASKTFRKNLFVTVKKRDLVYRILCTPKDWLFQTINFFSRKRKQNVLLYILLIPVWLLLVRYVFVGLFLWFALVWPLTKVYEYLTVGDIRARAGELGVQRRGLFGFRKWPVKIRLSIFAFSLILFWGGVAFACLHDYRTDGKEPGLAFLGLIIIGLLFFLTYYLGLKMKMSFKARAARKRAKRMESFFNPKREG